MKNLLKALQLLLISICLIPTSAICQHSLFQEGAVWIASHESNCGIGYEIYRYIGDSIHNGHHIKIIEQNIVTYSYELGDYYEGRKSQQYFMQLGNSLYKPPHDLNYIDTARHGPRLIFDYDARVGDSIIHYEGRNATTNALQVLTYTIIDSIKNDSIGNGIFKTWYGRQYQTNTRLKNTSVVYHERIGELTQFPLHPRNVQRSKDFPNAPVLIYYSDDTGFAYDPFNEYSHVIDMQEFARTGKAGHNSATGNPNTNGNSADQVRLTPNPASTYIEVTMPGDYTMEELDYEIHKMACGSLSFSGKIDNGTTRVDIANLENGIYLFVVKSKNNLRFVERFVKV